MNTPTIRRSREISLAEAGAYIDRPRRIRTCATAKERTICEGVARPAAREFLAAGSRPGGEGNSTSDSSRQDRRKRRWQLLAAVSLLLLVLALGALAAAYRASAPSFIAGALSSYLGRRVEIGALEFHPGQALVVELSQVRVYEGPEAEGLPMLELPHATGTQAWARLLVGQVIPLKWEIESPVLRTNLGSGDGDTELALPRVPPLDLVVRNASLVLRRPDAVPTR